MENNTEYNCEALLRLVKRLRVRAVFVVVLWIVIGFAGGAYVGRENWGGNAGIIGGVVGAIVGYLIGSMRSLYYKTRAMNLLCLKRIEENTRAK